MNREIIPWWWTELGEQEIKGFSNAVNDRHINCGVICAELEERLANLLQVPYVVLTTSGTSALLLAFLACDVGQDDEIIMPAHTFIAGAHAAKLLGARIRLVDIAPDRPTIDADKISESITSRTKVIMPVHANGVGCDMVTINNLAAANGLQVVEDTAQAFCSRNENGFLGTQSTLGIFSMGITKLITTGEGGVVVTRDATIADKIRKLRNHGVNLISGNIFTSFGMNLRFTDLLASVAHAQLDRLEEKISGVIRIYEFYSDQLANVDYLEIEKIDVAKGEIPLWTNIYTTDRDRVVASLLERGVQARPSHPCLADSKHLECMGDYPMARKVASEGLTLPSGPDQSSANLKKTVEALKAIQHEISW